MSRLAIALLLDLIDIARDGRDVLDTLLLNVIVQANESEVRRRADLQTAYAEPQGTPPDAMRRPISINALAGSVGLPFETVRRRTRLLSEQGFCRFVEGGLIVPASALSGPDYLKRGARAYERLRAFYYELADLDLLPELPRPSVHLEPDAFPMRAAARLMTDYGLREIAGLLGSVGGVVDGLIAFEVFRANTAHFPYELRGREGYAADDMVADAERRPVSIAAVAERLGIPPETVRRHVVLLMARGICKRVKGGLIVPAELFARADVRAAVFANAANLKRLFAGLSDLGVLKLWDGMRPAA